MARNEQFPRIDTLTPDTARRTDGEKLQYSELYPHEVAKLFDSDITNGLDAKQIRANRLKYGANFVSDGKLSWRTGLKRQYTNLLTVLLLFGALLVYAFERDSASPLVAVGSIVLSVVNVVLERRAGVLLAELEKSTSSRATVIRGGSVMVTDSRSIVCGDVIMLEDGAIVPADARLIECNSLTVLETPVSGISSAVKKDARFIQRKSHARVSENMVYAGSIVTCGNAVAVVCEVGANVLMNKRSRRGELMLPSVLRFTEREGRIVVIAAAVFEIVLMLVGALRGESIARVFLTSLSVGAVALTDTAFAFSSYAFADCMSKALKSGAAVRNFDCVPRLVGINSVMCDKQTAFPPTVVKADRLYDCFAEYRVEGSRSKKALQVLRYLLLCSSVNAVAPEGKTAKDKKDVGVSDRYAGSALALSLMDAAEGMGASREEIYRGFYRIESEYDSRGEMSRVLGLLDGSPIVIIKGAPENVISRCAGYRRDGTNLRFDDKSRSRALAFAEEISRTRTPIAVAVGHTTADSLRDITVERKLVLIGFAGLYSTFEVGAASAVFKCRQAGIEILVSSDDSYYTAYNTAKNAGIIDGEDAICTAEALRTTEQGLFIANCPRYKVFTGLNDGEWLYVEQLRHGDGKKIAVSASRIEQLPLMKEADVSFVPVRGSTDTLLSACDVQMKNDGFDTITETLKCARLAMKRVLNTSEYFSVGFMTMFFWALFSLIIKGSLPFTEKDVFLFGLVINVLLSVSIAFAPAGRSILSEPVPSAMPRYKAKHYAVSAAYSAVGGVLCMISGDVTLKTADGASLAASLVTFAFLLFFYSLMCGSNHSVLINKAYGNYLAFAMLAASAALMAGAMYIPDISSHMGYAPLGGIQLLVAAGIAFIFFFVIQVGALVKKAAFDKKTPKKRHK